MSEKLNAFIKKFVKGLLYIIGNFAFIFAAIIILGWLSLAILQTRARILEPLTLQAALLDHLYMMIIAVVFSQGHIRNLIKAKSIKEIEIKIANLIAAGLILAAMYLPSLPLRSMLEIMQRTTNFTFNYRAFIDFAGFIFWYNLIFAFRLKSTEVKQED